MQGAAALLASRPAQAAYGEAANVFGGKTNASGAPLCPPLAARMPLCR